MADRSHSSELTGKFSPGPAFRGLSSLNHSYNESLIFFCEADAVYEVLENEAGKTSATLPESLLQNAGLIPMEQSISYHYNYLCFISSQLPH